MDYFKANLLHLIQIVQFLAFLITWPSSVQCLMTCYLETLFKDVSLAVAVILDGYVTLRPYNILSYCKILSHQAAMHLLVSDADGLSRA